MQNHSPEKMLEILSQLLIGDAVTESVLVDLKELAEAWQEEQKELNACLNILLHDPVGYVDPTTLSEFRYSNVISGRIYADGDHAYTPVFTKDQFDDAGILQRPYVQIK